ncbi:MAG: DUF2254 domain-containing protein [Gammaproteobacteria bacterium]|nr:DUF2254 domain-containing protein [Gammaproteobacteria bacterium]
MLSKWQWLLSQLTRTLWIRASLFALLAVVTALIAIPAQHIIENPFPFSVGADSVGQILDILASSMLAVTTFSLSVMVAAYTAASSSVTPRATKLVQQDTTTQNVLATFIGSFLYSLVGIIALSTEQYGENGRLILFVVTIGVIVLIVITILRWIEHLSQLGRMGETTERVENAAAETITQRIKHPTLGAQRLTENTIPDNAEAIYGDTIGYVRHVDVGALNECAKHHQTEIGVMALPGEFVHPAKPIAWIRKKVSDEIHTAVCKAITLGKERSFDQDPRFGLSVLAEIASRALSPAVNDPGTAIDVINRGLRILVPWKDCRYTGKDEQIIYPNVLVPELHLSDLFDDIFMPIERDGTNMIEVQLRLQKALAALAYIDSDVFGTEVSRHLQLMQQRTENSSLIEADKQRLQTIYDELIR